MRAYQAAYSLLELTLVLAIIAIIVISATHYFAISNVEYQVSKTMQDVAAIRKAASEWVLNQPDYTGISLATLNSAGLLPKDVNTGGPWSGSNYAVTGTAQLSIAINGIPSTACTPLCNAIKNQALSTTPSCTGTSTTCSATRFTMVFG